MTRNVVINTWHGTMIVNRHDVGKNHLGEPIGVGHQLLTTGAFDRAEVELVTRILREIHIEKARPIIAHDLGANIGCHALVWAREFGANIRILAVEAQPRVFEMLCGNIAINNRVQITPLLAAIGGEDGEISFQVPDYDRQSTFGSLELRQSERSENIGQDLSSADTVTVPLKTLPSLRPGPPDFIKMDIEGMEEEALLSQGDFLEAHRTIIFCEHIKSDGNALIEGVKRLGYKTFVVGMNLLMVDPESRVMETIIRPGLRDAGGETQKSQ